MRVFLPAISLLLATLLTPLGISTVFAQGMCQVPENYADCGPGPCMDQGVCGVPCDSGPCGPRWSIAAEAVAYQRIPTRKQPLFSNSQTVLETDPLNARDLNSSVALGYQLSAIRHDVCGYDVEFKYFQVDGFTARATVPGTSYMVTDANGTGFLVNDGHARYASALYSGELNLRQPCADLITLLIGFRMVQLNEHYTADGTDTNLPSTNDWLGLGTFNHLYGFQLGADVLAYDMGGPLQVKATCRAGFYDNFAYQNYRRVSTDGTTTELIIASDDRTQTAFLGEAGVVATYAITERLAFRASAQAIWLTGVALAPEQIGVVNLRTMTDSIETGGATFLYGGGLGLEYRF